MTISPNSSPWVHTNSSAENRCRRQPGNAAGRRWDDILAEEVVGFYNLIQDSVAGWNSIVLDDPANGDLSAGLAADWFAIGAFEYFGDVDYYIEIAGTGSGANLPYLEVTDNPLYEPPTGLTCALNGVDVGLAWVNGPTPYDSIDIYEDGIVIDAVLGTDMAYTVAAPVYDMDHCYMVCGVVSAADYCSTECCLYVGDCADVVVDLGQISCPTGSLTASGDTTGAADYCEDANGDFFPAWRNGYTNVLAGDSYIVQFSQNLPSSGAVVGDNTFVLIAEDVTPVPYNQPPYPASGTTCTATNVVVANAP